MWGFLGAGLGRFAFGLVLSGPAGFGLVSGGFWGIGPARRSCRELCARSQKILIRGSDGFDDLLWIQSGMWWHRGTDLFLCECIRAWDSCHKVIFVASPREELPILPLCHQWHLNNTEDTFLVEFRGDKFHHATKFKFLDNMHKFYALDIKFKVFTSVDSKIVCHFTANMLKIVLFQPKKPKNRKSFFLLQNPKLMCNKT